MPARPSRTLSTRAVWSGAIAFWILACVAGLSVGELNLSLAQLWRGVWREDSLAATVIWNLRLPRVLVGSLVGAALSSSGVVMQAYFRNSLASPGLLGVTAGGATGAVVAIAAGWAGQFLLALPLAAICGAFLATLAVITLAHQGAGSERQLLAGIALNALLGAVVSYVLSTSTLTFERNAQILFWLLGGLEDRTWEHVLIASPILLAAVLLCPLGRPLDLLSLGEREALSLGVDVRRLRGALIFLTTVLTALATAVSGSVGFVGLIVPHLLRLTLGADHRRLLPLSFIVGGAFVVACDVAGRLAGGMRIGIITSLLGGPFFLWLLRRRT